MGPPADPHARHDMGPPDVTTSADNPGRPPETPPPAAALSGPAHAADAVWGFLVQREVMGLRDRAAIVAHYGVPREVLARLGAR